MVIWLYVWEGEEGGERFDNTGERDCKHKVNEGGRGISDMSKQFLYALEPSKGKWRVNLETGWREWRIVDGGMGKANDSNR